MSHPIRTTCCTPEQTARDLALRDLTDPASGPHAIQLVVDRAVAALAAAWGCEVRWWRGTRAVSVEENYDRLGFLADSVSRDRRYTRYVDDDHMLRSHSSAMVPAALDALAASPADDVLLVCPGICYRRDAIDWQHTGTPHQLDLWRIRRDGPSIRAGGLGPNDMEEMTLALLGALAPGLEWRREPRVHPYTLGGSQVDVCWGGQWVEVWECGLAHPSVLAGAGLGAEWSGLALGMGLDRFVMLAKGVPDIRLLRSEDPRIATQMLDLEPYRPVSAMPAVRRDLSVALGGDEDEDDETLGDRVRDALGDDAACVEEVAVVSITPVASLPAAARERLGATTEQKNLLVRLVLRNLERTLTDAEANELRDRVYASLHRGAVFQWASGPVGQSPSAKRPVASAPSRRRSG